jgi:hypothetical protein
LVTPNSARARIMRSNANGIVPKGHPNIKITFPVVS